MLMEVKNQLKVMFLSIKYALMREMLNKVTFITNILFMILNNAAFIVQWIIIYSFTDTVGSYTFNDVLLLWGLAGGTYGISRFFFASAFKLSTTINEGKLDSYLVQPKNVLCTVITSSVTTSAIGDIIYAYILLVIYGLNFTNFILFTYFLLAGGVMLTCLAIIFASLSFWFSNTEGISSMLNSLFTNFATYPDSIFEGITKVILYTVVPVGVINYIPVSVIREFDIYLLIISVAVLLVLIVLAFTIFYRGLKKYSSSNLMIAKN